MNLSQVIPIAEKIRTALLPLCARIEIAGSVRRRRDWVNDIDLVILPQFDCRARIEQRMARSCRMVTNGEQNSIWMLKLPDHSELQVDLFFARPARRDLLMFEPGNFGSLLVLRTGSKQHNIWMIQHAKEIGREWRPQSGVFVGEKCIAGETEAEIFSALNLEFIPPTERER